MHNFSKEIKVVLLWLPITVVRVIADRLSLPAGQASADHRLRKQRRT